MKKLSLISLAAIGLMALYGCDANTIDIDTTLKTTVESNITAPASMSPDLKVAAMAYPFTSSQKLSLKDNEDVKKYLDRLEDINIKSVTCMFSGIPASQTITELKIAVTAADMVVNVTTVVNNSSITLEIPKAQLDKVSQILLDQQEITITVSGKSTYAPMTLSTALSFATTIQAKVL